MHRRSRRSSDGRTPSSSAAASAAWPPPSGWARAATASPCSRGSTRPAAAPTCTARTASPSTPARPSSPRPFLFEELWTLCGRRLADDVDLRPLDPFYRIRFHDGADVRLHGRPRGDARGGGAALARRRRGLRALHARERGDLPRRLREARPRPVRFVDANGADRCPQMVRLQSYRSVYGLVAKLRAATSACAWCCRSIRCSSAAIRSTPPPSTGSSRTSSASWGVHFAMGGTGALVRGLVGLIEGQGGTLRCNARGRARSRRRGRARHRRAARGRRDASPPTSSCRTPTRRGPTATCCPARRAAAGPTAASSARATRWASSSGTSARGAQYEDVRAPHDPARAALSRAARRHLRAQGARRGLQPVPAPPDGDRPVAGAGGLRRVLRALAGAASRQRHRLARRRPSRTGSAIAQLLEETVLPGLEDEIVTSRDAHAAGLPGPPARPSRRRVRDGAGAHAERVLPAAQPERGRRGPLPRRRRNASRRRACPACCRRRASSTVVPDAAALRLTPPPRRAPTCAACRRAAARQARRTFLRRLAAPARARARAGARALRVLPPRRRRRRRCGGRRPRQARRGLRQRLDARLCRPAAATHAVDRAFAESWRAVRDPARAAGGAARGHRVGRARARPTRRSTSCAPTPCASPARSGAMMALVMGAREPDVLARACDLGVAMQLTNIARDVGEDARDGRVYLPLRVAAEAGVDPDAWLAAARARPGAGRRGRASARRGGRALRARRCGHRALPAHCRPASAPRGSSTPRSAREVRRAGSTRSPRARWCPRRARRWLLARATLASLPGAAAAPLPLEATRYLVEAVAQAPAPRPAARGGWSGTEERAVWVIDLFDRLERRDRHQVGRRPASLPTQA